MSDDEIARWVYRVACDLGLPPGDAAYLLDRAKELVSEVKAQGEERHEREAV